MTVDSFDVVVVGGGPAGHAAALEAAFAGARVALVEAEQLGGQCVHATCIPSAITTGAASTFADAQELGVVGIADIGDTFHLGRAAGRRQTLVKALADGTAASLRMAGVEVVDGRGLVDGEKVVVDGRPLGWKNLVLATGSRWEAPALAGIAADRVTTPDGIHGLGRPPTRTTVVAGGTGRTAFSLESAAVLALAGSTVTVVAPGGRLLPWLDDLVDQSLQASLEDLGITVATNRSLDDLALDDPDLVVAPDDRRPFGDGLGLESLGLDLDAETGLAIDDHGRTSLDRVFAAGDLTGGAFLTVSAIATGRAAGAAATGRRGPPVPAAAALPHSLHLPAAAWVGLGAAEAEAAGWDVMMGAVDLTHTAAGVVAGGRGGVVLLVADAELGQVLGVQAVGPGAGEIVQLASAAVQSELRVDDVAAWALWHPSPLEALVDAARAVVGQRS